MHTFTTSSSSSSIYMQQRLRAVAAACMQQELHAAAAACSNAACSISYVQNYQRTIFLTTKPVDEQLLKLKRTKRKTKNSRITKCPRTHTRESERENVVEKREQKRNYKIYTTSENTGRGGIVVKLRKYLEFGLERERGRVNCRDQMYIVLSSFSIIG